jgi:hypothetical protein
MVFKVAVTDRLVKTQYLLVMNLHMCSFFMRIFPGRGKNPYAATTTFLPPVGGVHRGVVVCTPVTRGAQLKREISGSVA